MRVAIVTEIYPPKIDAVAPVAATFVHGPLPVETRSAS
jgi:hypothetical protein